MSADEAAEAARNLSDASTTAEIRACITALNGADPLDVQRVLALVHAYTRQPIAVLRQVRRQIIASSSRSRSTSPQWTELIRLNRDGEPIPDAANLIIPLRLDKAWAKRIAFDEFHQRPVFRKKPPWANGHWTGPSPLSDVDESRVLVWLQNAGIHCRIEAVRQALGIVCEENRFHPVRDYLDSLVWDDVPRLDRWLTYYLGVEPIANYTEPVAARWMIGGIARIYQPGCLAKYCLVLEGEQDLKKSSALRVLGDPWFTDDVAELGSKDSAMQVGNAWIVELAELDSVRKAHISAIKAFISRTVDKFRPPYGRHVIEQQRQCILAGTVNPSTEYLTDETGGVRFWPVACTSIDLDALRSDRDQLWAEAKHRYDLGEKWWLEDEMLPAARDQQDARFAADSWEDPIRHWLDANPMLDNTTTAEILKTVFEIPLANHDKPLQTRVGIILTRRLGWSRHRIWTGKSRQYVYSKSIPTS